LRYICNLKSLIDIQHYIFFISINLFELVRPLAVQCAIPVSNFDLIPACALLDRPSPNQEKESGSFILFILYQRKSE